MALATGIVLNNRYRIVKLIAQGGFGAVYLAWDLSLSRACAVKENLDTSPQAQQQFEREAKILANLNHPNLARVIDYFFIPGQGQYLVMDYVEGEDLQEMLDRSGGPLAENQVLPWITQVCEALEYLHGQNPPIIHRDIKPANIKITPQGQAMLVDFGIAKVYDPGKKTTIGARGVTPGYSPLEQYGRGGTDQRSDVYALGATLYCLLTGRVPCESIRRLQGDTLVLPQQLNPSISTAAAAAIMKAMQMDAGQRFASAGALKQALCLEGGTTQGGRRIWRFLSIRTMLVFAGLIVLIGVAAVLIAPRVIAASRLEKTATAFAALQTNMALTGEAPSVLPTGGVETQQVTLISTKTQVPTRTSTPSPIPSPTLSPTPRIDPILVEPYCDMFDKSPVYVRQHQPVIIWWRWDAKSEDLVRDHLAAAHYRILLDGVEITAESMSEIEYLKKEGYYRVSWYADVGALALGRHLAERYLSWDWKISDGWTTFGPGGQVPTEHHVCEIIVR